MIRITPRDVKYRETTTASAKRIFSSRLSTGPPEIRIEGMRSLAQKIKAEDRPPLILYLTAISYTIHSIYLPVLAYIIHVLDRSLTGRLKMRGEIFPC